MNQHPDGFDSNRQPAIKAGWLRAIIFLVAAFAAIVAGEIVVGFIYDVNSQADMMRLANSPNGVVAQLIQLLPIFLVVWLFCRFIDRRSLGALGFRFDRGARKDLVSGLLWGVGLMVAIFLGLLAYGGIRITEISFDPASLLIAAALMAMVALDEEMIFRGYLLANLMDSVNKYIALAIIAAIFSVSHIVGPNTSIIGLVNIILGGLFLGIYYVHRRNLWFPIGVHFSWNLFQGPVLGSNISGWTLDSVIHIDVPGSELLTGGEFGFEASLITTVAMIAGILILHAIYRDKHQKEVSFPTGEQVSGITPQ